MTAESWGWLTLIAVVWAVLYAGACWVWPFASCGKCKGGGRKRSPSKKYWRPCRKCKGTGTQLRTGRKIWNKLLSVKKDAAG